MYTIDLVFSFSFFSGVAGHTVVRAHVCVCVNSEERENTSGQEGPQVSHIIDDG